MTKIEVHTPEVPSRKERRKQWKAFRKHAVNHADWRDSWDQLTGIAANMRQERDRKLKARVK